MNQALPHTSVSSRSHPSLRWQLLTLCLTVACWAQGGLAGVNVQLKIEGVKGEQLNNVKAFLSLQQRKSEDSLTDRWVRRLHAQGPGEIRTALEPFGYYKVRVTGSLKQVDGKWLANYQIKPGKPVRVTSLDLHYTGEGAGSSDLPAAISAFPLAKGDILVHESYDTGKSNLVRAAQQLGYVKANATSARVVVDTKANSAAITVVVDTGPRYYYGEVNFHQDFLNPALLEKTLSLQPGEPYAPNDVIAFQQALQLTDWAAVVNVEPRFDDAQDERVPIDVTLEPNKRHHFALGVGYETDIGPRVSARWTQRRINRAGHHAEAFTRLSPVQRTIGGAYLMPVGNPLTDRLSTNADYEYEKTPDTERNTLNGEFAFVRRSIDDRNFYKVFVELRREEYQVTDEPTELSRLLSIGYARRYTKLDFTLFPQTGQYLDFEARAGSSAVVSDTSYLRLRLDGSFLFPLGTNGRLKVHSQLGASVVEFFEKYPTSLRYFAGGDISIRGFHYKSLGPEDDNGNVVGGKNLLVAGAQYDHRVARQWVVAGFVDAGNAFNDSLDKVNIGAGVGVRWLMEFGSLSVDFAWPMSDEDVKPGDGMIHIGFGAAL
jgi:translocation and assembly module TamA